MSIHWPGNEQALCSLIFALTVMITARQTHRLFKLVVNHAMRTTTVQKWHTCTHTRTWTRATPLLGVLLRQDWVTQSLLLSVLFSPLKPQKTPCHVWLQQNISSPITTSWDSSILVESFCRSSSVHLWWAIGLQVKLCDSLPVSRQMYSYDCGRENGVVIRARCQR